MAANCGKTSRVENHDLEVSGANTCPTDVPNNVLQLERVHHILDQMATPTATTPAKPKTSAEDDEFSLKVNLMLANFFSELVDEFSFFGGN